MNKSTAAILTAACTTAMGSGMYDKQEETLMDESRGLWRGKTTPKRNGEAFNNIWVNGDLIHSNESYYIHPFTNSIKVQDEIGRFITMHEVIPSTLGACTGGTDRNGKFAFEGDLVKYEFNDVIGVIRYGEYRQPFNDDKFTMHIGFYIDWLEGDDKGFFRVDLGYWLPLVEVVGNIHDNPDYLKGGKQQ